MQLSIMLEIIVRGYFVLDRKSGQQKKNIMVAITSGQPPERLTGDWGGESGENCETDCGGRGEGDCKVVGLCRGAEGGVGRAIFYGEDRRGRGMGDGVW